MTRNTIYYVVIIAWIEKYRSTSVLIQRFVCCIDKWMYGSGIKSTWKDKIIAQGQTVLGGFKRLKKPYRM